jgi:hypothetical protein
MDEGSPLEGLLLFIVVLLVNLIMFGFSSAIQSLNESDIQKNWKVKEKKRGKSLKSLTNRQIH